MQKLQNTSLESSEPPQKVPNNNNFKSKYSTIHRFINKFIKIFQVFTQQNVISKFAIDKFCKKKKKKFDVKKKSFSTLKLFPRKQLECLFFYLILLKLLLNHFTSFESSKINFCFPQKFVLNLKSLNFL